MKESPHKQYRSAGALVLLVVAFSIMAFVLYAFSREIESNQAQVGKERLSEVAAQNVAFVNAIVEDRTTFMEAIANDLSEIDDLKSAETIRYLNKICAGTDFTRLAIDFLNGESYTSDGHVVNISDLGYIDEIEMGEAFITGLVSSKVDSKPCISMLAPIKRNGKVVAAARGTIDTQQFGQVLDVGFFNGEGYFHLLNSKGEYLALPTNSNAFLMDENYFSAIQKLNFDEGYSAQQVSADIQAGKRGATSYCYNGLERYAEYIPVGIADWYLMIITPKQVIDENARIIQAQAFSLVVKLLIVAFAVFIFILIAIKYSTDEIKKMNEKLAVEEKRYRFLLERTDNVIFEYDLKDGAIGYSEKFSDMFGHQPTVLGLPYSVIKSGGIHPDDANRLLMLFQDVKNGKPNTSAEFRIRHDGGAYIWCSIVAATIFSEDGEPAKALGVIENIDVQKQRELALITKAEKDQLTGVYNKITTEHLIEDFLNQPNSSDKCHALMIIDVDDFKMVNDKLGHLYGDIVLANLASGLKLIFRDSDIIGRIGGDEFFVFIKNMTDSSIAETKAKEICCLFQKTYAENNISCTISASVGITLFPQHGKDFKALYKNADSALYVAKANGKSSYAVYDGETVASYTSRRVDAHEGAGAQKNFRENKIEYIFKMLYESKDPTSAVHHALQLLADFFSFSSSYIFELDSAGKAFLNTFNWHTESTLGISGQAKSVDVANMGQVHDALQKDNLFVMRKLDSVTPEVRAFFEQMGVKSLFLFGMREGEELVGFIGFDDCAKEQGFASEELDEIITVCKMLTIFLLKQRALENAQNNYYTISEIMNKMNYYGYVVEDETYELLFANDKIRGIAAGAKVGLPCYKSFMDRDTPCPICPIEGLSPAEMSNTVEIHNNAYNIYSKTTASRISWIKGKKAYLISSIDVSDYKPEDAQP